MKKIMVEIRMAKLSETEENEEEEEEEVALFEMPEKNVVRARA